jgi:hypothetical protein
MDDDTPSQKRQPHAVPEKMKALQYGIITTPFQLQLSINRYSGPEKFAVDIINVPEIGDDDVLVSLSRLLHL